LVLIIKIINNKAYIFGIMKKLNTNIFKVLIKTEFGLLFINKTLAKKDKYHNTSVILKNINKNINNNVSFLNFIIMIKAIKQFIRVLYFIKKKNTNILHVKVLNVQHLNCLNHFFKKVKVTNILKIKADLRLVCVKDISQLVLLLNTNCENLKKFTDNKISLIYKTNLKSDFINEGVYKMHNDFSDFKKIIFLIALLKQTLF
jgi:hypothetical protein